MLNLPASCRTEATPWGWWHPPLLMTTPCCCSVSFVVVHTALLTCYPSYIVVTALWLCFFGTVTHTLKADSRTRNSQYNPSASAMCMPRSRTCNCKPSPHWRVPSFATEFMGCSVWRATAAANISHSYWHYSAYCTTGPSFGDRTVPTDTFGACILGWGAGTSHYNCSGSGD